ncbi:Vacuolar protein sorting-associated protein 5 [Entomortierella beljakovae]|nr:Vacuolar protein sorting-associated protein 5 [Entomortierella beljakovae]
MHTMSLRVSVPEAASSGGTITFKILVNNGNNDSTYPIFRTFSQVRWLQNKLQSAFVDYVIPPIPDSISEKLSEDVDQVEQKRIQIERFLQRICHRTEFATSDPVLWFVGTEMNDQGEFQRRQVYIFAMEQSFTGILETGARLTKEHEKLGDVYSQLGDSTMEVLSSKYRLGDGQRIDNRERHQALDEEMQIFGVLTDDLRLSIRRQAKSETFHFMDLVQEYKSMLQGMKVIMNSRTDRLSDYVSASKNVAKKQGQLEQAVQKAAISPAGDLVDKAQSSVESANAKLDGARDEFSKSQEIVTRELLRYEKDKAKEWQTTVKDYAEKQVMYEKEMLSALEKAWVSIQDLRTNAKGESIGGNSSGHGPSSEPSGRSRSYWPSGLGSPITTDFVQELTESLQSGASLTKPTPLVSSQSSNHIQERLPQNAGVGSGNVSGYNSDYNSGHTSGYNSGYNSGYTSGEQDEGHRSEPGYFPATKLSRSGSGVRTNKTAELESPVRRDTKKGMTSSSSIPVMTAAVNNNRKDDSAFALNFSSSPLTLETPSKIDVPISECEDKNKDGYDPLMVRPGFTD